MSTMCIPGPSRSIFRHLTHFPLPPRSHISPAIPSYRHISSTSILHSDSRRQAYTLAQPLDSSSDGGFEGIPAAAYAGAVDTASSKGKGKEVDRHAAPEPPSPLKLGAAPAGERKRVIKAKKSAITMTPAAIERLRGLLSNPTPQLLRIGVKTRGCAGMAYHLDYVSPPGGKFDEVVEQDGVRVLIDSKALFSIIGSKMDWRDNRLSAGFVFDNPNIEDTCGCGESFNIRV